MDKINIILLLFIVHCKCFDHRNYGDWKLRGPCRENLQYLWKRAVRIAGNPHDNYRTYNYHGVSPQFLQPFSIDSADFPCRDPAISSPRSFYGQNICSVQCIEIVHRGGLSILGLYVGHQIFILKLPDL